MKFTRKTTLISLLLVVFVLAVVPTAAQGGDRTLFDRIENRENFSTLTAALVATGLDATLDTEGLGATLLAPTDRAFERLAEEEGITVDDLLADLALLEQVLTYHVIGAEVNEAAVRAAAGTDVATLEGSTIHISVNENDRIVINGNSRVGRTDVQTSNGIYHVINRVLLPTDAFGFGDTLYDQVKGRQNFSVLTAALEATGLDAVLDSKGLGATLLAPTDRAFQRLAEEEGITVDDLLADLALLEQVLTYHVIGAEVNEAAVRAAAGTDVATLEGSTIHISVDEHGRIIINGNSRVGRTDVQTSNGIYHVINRVLLPIETFGLGGSLYDEVKGRDNFSILTAALEATELDAVLDSKGLDATLLAPTDRAFQRLAEEKGITVDFLLANPDLLTAVLTYHVVPVVADEATVRSLDGSEVETLEGAPIHISIDEHTHRILINDDARVGATDRTASNGIYHVINRVLLPYEAFGEADPFSSFGYNDTLFDNVSKRDSFLTLTSLLERVDLAAVLDQKDFDGSKWTLLAPNDRAFERTIGELVEALGQDAVDALLADDEVVTAILLYHVVPAEAPESLVRSLDGAAAPTVLGQEITVEIDDHDRIILNGNVIVRRTDVEVSNGLYHTINRVLIPDLSAFLADEN